MNPDLNALLHLLWRSSTDDDRHVVPSADCDVVLVDLMHGNAEFVMRTLLVAKALQTATGCELVGIVGAPGVVNRSAPVDHATNRSIAEAFEVKRIIEVPNEFDVPDIHQDIFQRIIVFAETSAPGTPLSEAARMSLAAIQTKDGFGIGRVITETFMRAELQAHVLAGDALVYWARHVLGFDYWTMQHLAAERLDAFVTGHIDYCPWGHLAERLVRTGGRTVYFRCDDRIPIDFIDDLEADETLGGRLRRIDAQAFKAFESRIAASPSYKTWTNRAYRRVDAVRQGLSRNWRWTRDGAISPKIPTFDDTRPTYVLFAPTFTDQPLTDISLFVTHADWLWHVLNRATRAKRYNLIIKPHPLDSLYDHGKTTDRLKHEFAGVCNIEFVSSDTANEAFVTRVDAALTVRGTPGIEFASLGLPVILGGRGLYSDIGFCLCPDTREEYFQLLENGPPFPLDMTDAARRAKLFHAFSRFWSAPASPFLPPFLSRSTTEAERAIAEGTRTAVLETDPVVLALARAWPKRNAKVLPLELDAALEDRADWRNQSR